MSETKNEERQAELYRAGALLGLITLSRDECDFPWFVGTFEPSSAFEAVRELFDQQARALDRAFSEDPADAEAERDYERLYELVHGPGIRLRWLHDGAWDDDVMGLTIEGRRVAWR